MAQSRVMEPSRTPDTPTIRERFDSDGWALVPRFLTSRDVESLRAATDELASKGASLRADGEIDGARYEVQTANGRRGESAVAPGALRKITFASSASVAVALLRNDRRILQLVESVGVTSPRWIVDSVRLAIAAAVFVHAYAWIKLTIPLLHRHLFDQALWDLDARFHAMDQVDGYVQVLTLCVPPIETVAKGQLGADLARLRGLITQEQFMNVARNAGYSRFIRRLDDGRWVCELAPKLEDVPDE